MRRVWFPGLALNWRGVRSCMAQGFLFMASGVITIEFIMAAASPDHTVTLNIDSFGEMWWELPMMAIFGIAFVWWYFQERIYDR